MVLTTVLFMSNCVVLFLFSRCYGLFCYVVFFSSPFSIVITSLEKERAVHVLLVHLFVYFEGLDVCPSSLPLGVGGWLRLVIVALPGLFYYLFLFPRYFTLTVYYRKSMISYTLKYTRQKF